MLIHVQHSKGQTASSRYFVITSVCAFIILCSCVAQSMFSHVLDNPSAPCGVTEAAVLIALLATGFAAYFVIVFLILGKRLPRLQIGWVVAGAVLFRLTAVFGAPLFDDDFYRYIWDGKVTAHGLNPYAHAPAEVLLPPFDQMAASNKNLEAATEMDQLDRLNELWFETPSEAALFSQINYPEVSTIYPPVTQAMFALAYAVSPMGSGMVYGFKGVFALLDIGIVLLLIGILTTMGSDPRWSVIYAWNPLAIKEIAGAGHMEPVAVLLLLAAVYFLIAKPQIFLAGGLMGLAGAAKLFPLVLLPAMTVFLWKKERQKCLLLPGSALVVFGLCYLPFLNAGARLFEGTQIYGSIWEMNSGFYVLVKFIVGGVMPEDGDLIARLVCLAMFGAVVLFGVRRYTEDTSGLRFGLLMVTVGLFLLSPVQNPWYIAWFLPLAALAPRWHWIVLSASGMLYYLYLALVTNPEQMNPIFDGILLAMPYLVVAFVWAMNLWNERVNNSLEVISYE